MAQQILSHTPYWVWGILALLVSLGVRMMKPRQVSARQLTMLPLVMTAYSLVSLYASFGAQSTVVPAWGTAWRVLWQSADCSSARTTFDTTAGGRNVSQAAACCRCLSTLSIFSVKFVIGFAAAQVPMLMQTPSLPA